MSESTLPDCLSLQECQDVGQVRAATMARRKAAKEEVQRLMAERLSATIVEIRLAVLAELLDLAAEGQEARERRARRFAPGSRVWTPEIQALARAGKCAHEIVAELGLPRTLTGPLVAHIKRGDKGGGAS